MTKRILHVSMADDRAPVTDEELKEIKGVIKDGLEKWGLDDEYEAFITGGEVSIHDVPALDNYVEEVADRVADKFRDT